MKKLLILLVILFCSSISFKIFAAEDEIIDADCRVYLAKQIESQEPDMQIFVNDQFSSSNPTSELIDATIAKISLYQDFLDSKLHVDWANSNLNISLDYKANQLFDCEVMISSNVDKWQQLIKQQVYSSSKTKSHLALINTYKRINDKLRELNNMIGNLKIYFQGFATNLPCITKKCITK